MKCNHMEMVNSEKYSRGRRGAPAKGVGRATGARVQIPLSPLLFPNDYFFDLNYWLKINKKSFKNCLTSDNGYGNIYHAVAREKQ